jgi:hypothetical protein
MMVSGIKVLEIRLQEASLRILLTTDPVCDLADDVHDPREAPT